jgi:hypothetical protein
MPMSQGSTTLAIWNRPDSPATPWTFTLFLWSQKLVNPVGFFTFFLLYDDVIQRFVNDV